MWVPVIVAVETNSGYAGAADQTHGVADQPQRQHPPWTGSLAEPLRGCLLRQGVVPPLVIVVCHDTLSGDEHRGVTAAHGAMIEVERQRRPVAFRARPTEDPVGCFHGVIIDGERRSLKAQRFPLQVTSAAHIGT